MRVFVTGATGFVGSAIIQKLIDAGHQVLGGHGRRRSLHVPSAATRRQQQHRGKSEPSASKIEVVFTVMFMAILI